MRRAVLAVSILFAGFAAAPPSFTVEQILDLPQPDNLIASPVGSTIAWTFNERGRRNIYAADGPEFVPRRVTPYADDDGQELTSLSFSSDGRTIVYVRGGDHGSNRPTDAPNPAGLTVQPKVQVWSVAAAGSAPALLGEGDDPAIAPDGAHVAFVRDRRIWIAPADGSTPAEAAFFARGGSESPVWSPDGRTLAFVSNRGDHSFIALFTPGQPIRYLAPSTSRDSAPAWSADGRRIAFLRQPGAGGAPRSPLVQVRTKWAILVAEVDRPQAAPVTAAASGDSPIDPILQNPNGLHFQWAADDTLIFNSYRDGWPHLYSLARPGSGSKPVLLTPGPFMVEQLTLSADRRFIVYNANTGSERGDIARRHLFRVPVDTATPVPLTAGTGIEWNPVATADGQTIAFLSADATRPPLPAVMPIGGGPARLVGGDRISSFPVAQLVVPEQVSFRASDGIEAHGQLFKPPASSAAARRPAIVYVHGGGPRQMLLGWHYRWEYANDYGINQYLASRGFIVLSVDYRLSVGYGQAFQLAERTGARGASEYRDILAAGQYLQKRSDVDPRRIGVWGASYGGYLTALALGRNSDVFAAGVDIHGVHDRLPAINPAQLAHALVGDGLSEADLRQALKVEFESSPIAAVSTWKSPVLLIHGDDDRTVDFRQTIDLSRRLLERGVRVEELVLPDDVHDPLLWRNWRATAAATGEFFERTLGPQP
ncbi:MAG: prolyl oligopeptidase family serine peptidase [Acidobacteriota bacterium]